MKVWFGFLLASFVLGTVTVKRPAWRSGWRLLAACVVVALMLSSFRFA